MFTVYQLTFSTGHVYLGSTKNLKSRLRRHRDLLKSNTHSNKNLANLTSNSSLDYYVSVIGEFADKEAARQAEYEAIQILKNAPNLLNQRLPNQHQITSFCKGIRKTRYTTPVAALDAQGGIRSAFRDASQAAQLVELRHGNIISVCQGKLKTTGGVMWAYISQQTLNRYDTLVEQFSEGQIPEDTYRAEVKSLQIINPGLNKNQLHLPHIL